MSTDPYGLPKLPRDRDQPMTYHQMPKKYITKERKQTSHLLHLILTILTAGIWGLLVWLPLTLWHKMGPKKKTKTVTK